jgi:hypothetical protein
MMPGIPVQSPVDNRGFHVKQLLGCGSTPSHLVLLAHAPVDQLIDGALQAVQVCPVSREAFLEIIPTGEIQEFLFDSRDPARNMEPIQTMLAFLPKPACLAPLAIRLRHPTGSSNPCLVLDRSAGEWLAPAFLDAIQCSGPASTNSLICGSVKAEFPISTKPFSRLLAT